MTELAGNTNTTKNPTELWARSVNRAGFTAEKAFDRAAQAAFFDPSRFDDAKRIASEGLKPLAEARAAGFFVSALPRLALKYAALPYYFRASIESTSDVRYSDPSIAAVYPASTALLEQTLQFQSTLGPNQRKKAVEDEEGGIGGAVVGVLSEQTAFSLSSRPIKGMSEDKVTIMPASFHRDHSSKPIDGQNTNIDFLVHLRLINEHVNLQVKTTEDPSKRYHSSVDIADMTKIAGGSIASLEDLQWSLVADAKGEASTAEVRHIDKSSRKFFGIYERRRRALGFQSLIAA